MCFQGGVVQAFHPAATVAFNIPALVAAVEGAARDRH